jgi:excinuclease ABC subunit A
VKLVSHLLTGLGGSRQRPGAMAVTPKDGALFLLEEPTIGLHMADVRRLVEVLHRLVDASHTVVVIEHNLDLIAEADWILDMGPEGGESGGRIVAEGTPEQIAKIKTAPTGAFLKATLAGAK